ncbi:TIGR04255 family protein [Pseudanabaena sp. UWO310]|uniref:TIGR04255 family protein n=1 Tax=Pseudanabaena sp. UWO310 TaxID=2480795 RepID=UPI001160E904|nr:TIGR04255 family protein [Pseudanabaena sp. UWO310]TYQ23683.1 TIGR04255 family protein [Pseudanabaena sp. UWO310]
MIFPDNERSIYQNNPLIEVVCQLRFPTILRISNHAPVEFQDEIRATYPIFEEVSPQVPVYFGKDNRLQQEDLQGQSNDVFYHFVSDDFSWQVSLSQNSIAIVTRNYRRYEEFKQNFIHILEIFEKIYKPSFYSRIGLRYKDLIVRSDLELAEVDWSYLIPQYIAPELHSLEIASSVRESSKILVMETEDGDITLRHGLVNARDEELNIEELAYLLDADFYKEGKIGKGDYVWELLDCYNKSARNLFRWCITDRLHTAMEPIPFKKT